MHCIARSGRHNNCTASSTPLETAPENVGIGQSHANNYSWELVPEYNEYTRRAVQGTRIKLLDVFPMTILRPDGHRVERKHDCLHYYLPGPPDFWNHLLLTLLDRGLLGRGGSQLRPVSPA